MYKNEKLEEFNNYLKNKKVAILGLGTSNTPLIDYLHKQGSDITVFDNRNLEILNEETLDKIYKYNIKFSFGENYLSKLIGFDVIFRSPSCMPFWPELEAELQRGAIITSEVEMFLELCPAKTIGVTGSDGKTTTTSLIYEMIKKQGYDCYLGGNIGIPLFTRIAEISEDAIVVLELSSFQLMGMEVSPNIAVVTNISPNHLDVHASYEQYIDAKSNIFKAQTEDDTVILNYDNDIVREFDKIAKGKVIYFSKETKLSDGVILDDGTIKICENNLRRHVVNSKNMSLKGIHNSINACTAVAATSELVSVENQVEVLKSFSGIPHRLEFVRETHGVKWYNDSIGTSPTRTLAGLRSFNEKIVLIAGGYDKNLDYEPLAEPIVQNVTNLILIGQTAAKIKAGVKREMEQNVGAHDCART
ncbi:MAG: UDP-N-acetylmuramoyl-L-alanine--D-glutamate ligase [Oscillospiraceae bacterium]|nr:UDP-N-acetylmuramoyl-L-alanine--D-glutamate ligase [Oscillospiraceae bacterium]